MRYGLIAAGRQTFDEVVVDPDQLANDRYAKFFFGHEDFGYVAKHAFDKLTGATRFDSTFYDEIAKRPAFDMQSEYRRLGLDPSYRLDDDPVNKLHHEDADALRAILPNVWRRFGPPS